MISAAGKNKILYIMCGVPGSGKSTYADSLAKDIDAIVFSRDKIRFNLVKEDEEYFSKEKEVFKLFVQGIKEGLKTKDRVIADATHLTKNSRKKLLDALNLDKDVKLACICVRPQVEVSLERNENRKGTRSYVPRGAIKRMNEQFEEPTQEEGFSYIDIRRN